jgi:hypothetical protein
MIRFETGDLIVNKKFKLHGIVTGHGIWKGWVKILVVSSQKILHLPEDQWEKA